MKTSKVTLNGIKSNITEGRKEFMELTSAEQAAKLAMEKFRHTALGQSYHLEAGSTSLDKYVRYIVNIKSSCARAIEKMKKGT